MLSYSRLVVASFLAAALVACGGTDSTTASTRADTVAGLEGSSTTGQTLFSAQCAACHGASGGGGTAPAVAGVDALEAIEAMLAGPEDMPVYTALTDQQLADIAAFVAAM
jgi:mono/diheme cytochrome c family protein